MLSEGYNRRFVRSFGLPVVFSPAIVLCGVYIKALNILTMNGYRWIRVHTSIREVCVPCLLSTKVINLFNKFVSKLEDRYILVSKFVDCKKCYSIPVLAKLLFFIFVSDRTCPSLVNLTASYLAYRE